MIEKNQPSPNKQIRDLYKETGLSAKEAEQATKRLHDDFERIFGKDR